MSREAGLQGQVAQRWGRHWSPRPVLPGTSLLLPPNSLVSTLSCILCTLQDTSGQVHVCPYPSTARLQDRDVALLQGAPGCTGTLTSDRLSFKCFVSHRECGDTQQCQKLPETRTPTAYLFIGWAVTEACGRPGTRRRASFLHTAGRGLRAGLTLACNAPC